MCMLKQSTLFGMRGMSKCSKGDEDSRQFNKGDNLCMLYKGNCRNQTINATESFLEERSSFSMSSFLMNNQMNCSLKLCNSGLWWLIKNQLSKKKKKVITYISREKKKADKFNKLFVHCCIGFLSKGKD